MKTTKLKEQFRIEDQVNENNYVIILEIESRRKNRTKNNKKDMLTYDKHMEIENEIENVNDIERINNKEYLLKLQNLLNGEFIELSIEDITKEAESFIAQALVNGDIHRTFPEYANHFTNKLKKLNSTSKIENKKSKPNKINDIWKKQ